MNEEKFTGKAEIYAKYRPSYTDEFIDYLYRDMGFKGSSRIADIGAGTGIFTELLLKRGSIVCLVEPNHDMFCTAKSKLAKYADCCYSNATAEETKLKDNSVDFVTAAQAFHWFQRDAFKEECKRILKPDGKVLLVWNSRVESAPMVLDNNEINKKYCINYKGFSAGNSVVNSEEYNDFFKTVEYKEFDNNLYFSCDGFVGRNLSSSYAPKPGAENYLPYIKALEELFSKYERHGKVMMQHITVSYVGEV